MFIASQKKKENIAEYLLYMWQIEDLIRANDLDIDKIKANVIDQYSSLSQEQYQHLTDWYESLVDMMRSEGVAQSGHLQLNKNVIIHLNDLHIQLLKSPKHPEYSTEFYRVLPFIVELRSRQGENKLGEIETCFALLYGTIMLRLQNREISNDTQVAIKHISHFLALLSHYHRLDNDNSLFNDD